MKNSKVEVKSWRITDQVEMETDGTRQKSPKSNNFAVLKYFA